jgi:hypothetical protein
MGLFETIVLPLNIFFPMSKPGPRAEFFFNDDNIEMHGIDDVIHPAASPSLDNGISSGNVVFTTAKLDIVYVTLNTTIMDSHILYCL